MSSRSLLLLFLLPLVASICEGQYRNYSLRCLAPIIENIDPNAPKTLQEAFLAGPKHFADPIKGIGADSIEFPISTESEEAQELFEQGIALLHVLWYEEAERAFRTVVELDPDCPMGYWGLAQASERTPQKARLFAEAARDRCDRNRPRIEQEWTALLADFYTNSDVELSVRSASRIRAIEELALDFPEVREVSAFLIRRLTLDQFVFGLPVTSTLGVDTLAEEFAKKYPKHPSLHYRVFLWMNRRPERLLGQSVGMTELSPRAAEIWRYAAEAHSAAARSFEAAILSEAALRTDHEYLAEQVLMPWQAQNLRDNYTALVDLLIGAGRIDESISWVKHSLTLPRQLNDSKAGLEHLWMSARTSAGQWETLLEELESDPILRASDLASDRALRLSWKGIVHLALGQMEQAEVAADQLVDLERNALIEGISAIEEASIAESRKRLSAIGQLFEQIPNPASEDSLKGVELPVLAKARLLELTGRNGQAFKLVEADRERRSYQWLPTAVFCRLAKNTGNDRAALFPLDRRFRSDSSVADGNLDVLEDLGELAGKLRLPEDWMFPPPKSGLEIDLESRGPSYWQAPEASEFDLKDRLGKSWNLAQFSGRPVLVHFFLGVQCAFCLEQFDIFQPHLSAFEEAGIDMLAISIDSQESLQKFLGEETTVRPDFQDRLPFPVLADPDLKAFRQYGVFDDFENGPMHATVLISSDGKILWRNIDHSPFTKPEELLSEARRLLEIRSPIPSGSAAANAETESHTAP